MCNQSSNETPRDIEITFSFRHLKAVSIVFHLPRSSKRLRLPKATPRSPSCGDPLWENINVIQRDFSSTISGIGLIHNIIEGNKVRIFLRSFFWWSTIKAAQWILWLLDQLSIRQVYLKWADSHGSALLIDWLCPNVYPHVWLSQASSLFIIALSVINKLERSMADSKCWSMILNYYLYMLYSQKRNIVFKSDSDRFSLEGNSMRAVSHYEGELGMPQKVTSPHLMIIIIQLRTDTGIVWESSLFTWTSKLIWLRSRLQCLQKRHFQHKISSWTVQLDHIRTVVQRNPEVNFDQKWIELLTFIDPWIERQLFVAVVWSK